MFLAVPAPYFPDLILVALASLGIGLASASAAVFNHIHYPMGQSKTNYYLEIFLISAVIYYLAWQ
jgi:hypothetical protein